MEYFYSLHICAVNTYAVITQGGTLLGKDEDELPCQRNEWSEL